MTGVANVQRCVQYEDGFVGVTFGSCGGDFGGEIGRAVVSDDANGIASGKIIAGNTGFGYGFMW